MEIPNPFLYYYICKEKKQLHNPFYACRNKSFIRNLSFKVKIGH